MDQDQLYDVIIIGAGIASISASLVLSQHNVTHIIIQATNRIGGRIASQPFEDKQVEIGASFVHSPKYNHLDKFIEEIAEPKIKECLHQQVYFYQNQGIMQDKHIYQAWQLHQAMQSKSSSFPKIKHSALDLCKLMEPQLQHKTPLIKDAFNWIVQLQANVQGCDLHQMSLEEFIDDKGQTSDDYLPANGYSHIVSTLFQQSKANVKLEHIVRKIKYRQNRVEVHTNRGVFHSKKVISSLPLGVMQHKTVQFDPPLPLVVTETIQNMGNGVANKIFASFEHPFWQQRVGWINFISSSSSNRYPVGLILPYPQNNTLMIFVSGCQSKMLSNWQDEQVKADLEQFLSMCTQSEVTIKTFKMTRWHHNEHFLGSYSFRKVGQNQQKCSEILRKNIQGRIWMIGEHVHPEMTSCVQGAFQTGQWASQQILQQLSQASPKLQ